jgi:phosphoglycerol transferase
LLALSSLFLFGRSADVIYRGWRRIFALFTGLFGLLLIAFLVSDYFTNKGIDESVVFHISYGLGGAGFSEFAWLIGVGLVLMSLTLVIPLLIWRRNRNPEIRPRKSAAILPVLLMALAIAVNPASGNLLQISREIDSDLVFTDYYRVPPDSIEFPVQKNLVFLYLEGMEHTFFDENLFPGLTSELNGLFAQHTIFTDIEQVPNTGWTIAGLIATQCGIPMHFPSHGNSLYGLDLILPGTRCLGDLLQDKGYKLAFYGGADLEFAGKGKFLNSHGFTDVYGRSELQSLISEPGYQSGWGLYDDSLLDLAFGQVSTLATGSEPFATFILTLDTHIPNGNPSRSCDGHYYADGADPMLNAVACTDLLVAGFIKRLLGSPAATNTLIVVMSDHLMMRNSVSAILNGARRKNLLAVLDLKNPQQATVATPGSTLDIAATVLGYMGAQAEIGLGRDLRSTPSVSRTIPGFNTAIKAWKSEILSLWFFPDLDGGIWIDPDVEQVEIDGRRFELPILIEYDSDLKSQLYFEFDSFELQLDLKAYYREIPVRSGVIWIDKCAVMKGRGGFGHNASCILMGRKGGGAMRVRELDGKIHLTSDQMQDFQQ